ncbi:MAG: dodecin domain-containing protein [Polyangiaceae bacterium]|nr:dodecin domain-containing protein [Polyangiaceae bacterium]
MGQRSRRDTISHSNVVKVIEVLAESEHSWEDAAQMALREASRTIRNIKSIYVKDMQAVVREGRIVCYRLNAKISFALEGNRESDEYDMREDRYGRY